MALFILTICVIRRASNIALLFFAYIFASIMKNYNKEEMEMDNSTYEMIENGARTLLSQIDTLDLGTKEGVDVLAKVNHFVELLVTLNKDASDYEDKAERRKIEKERNEAMAEIERDKQKITWERVGLEMSKVIIPLLIQVIAFSELQKRMFIFEKTDSIHSFGGREMHLPRFWK